MGNDLREMADKPLTTRQRLFVEAYLVNPNATEAARQAGYKGNENTLAQRGAELVRNSKISKFIEQRVEKAAITANQVLTELADIAKSKWRDFVDVRIDGGEIVSTKMRLTDKIRALELLGKHLKLFSDKIEITGTDGSPLFPKDISLTINAIYGDDDSDNSDEA